MTDTAHYLTELNAELVRAGIRGVRRERIIAEFADHLDCDPGADLGDPVALAAQFADELGTSFARTAAFWAFLALALVGILVGVRLVALLPLRAVGFDTGDTVALLISAVAGQVALVAGGLGLLRALRLRGRGAIPRQEAAVLAVGLVALVAVAPAVVRAARLRPQASGEAGDLLADLGALRPVAARISGGSVNRLALALGVGLATVIALTGIAANDPYDGILRGLLEGGAFLGAYAGLGRYLGIRR